MANCNSCNGGCKAGALNSLCRTGCRFPYYTGPCPAAPCATGCGNSCGSGCRCRCNAAVIDLNDDCHTCGNACGCNHRPSGGCGSCGNACGCNHRPSGECNACGCNGVHICNHHTSDGSCGCDSCGWECDSCGCSNHGASCCSNCGHSRHGCRATHGVFTCGGPVNLSAGGSVNFESRCMEPNDFSVSYGSILIRRPGLYYVHITADIPKNAEVDTVMRLELDGQIITPPELAIATGCGCGSSNHSGCAIIRACSGSVLKLVTLRDLCIESTTAQPIFTLLAMPIDPCCNH